MSRLFAALVFLLGFLPAVASAETLLLMAEEDGCYWCAKWNEEIGTAYPKTIEGKTAPLKRYDLRLEKPDVAFKSRVRFTPTFVLVKDGKEMGRIEGYPGEDFFWPLLTQLLKRAKIPLDTTG